MDYTKKKEFIINILYWSVILVLVYGFLKYIFRYISPFVMAFIIAAFLQRPARYLAKKTQRSLKWSAVGAVSLFYVLVVTLMSVLGIQLFGWIAEFIMSLPQTYTNSIEPFLNSVFLSIETSFHAIDPESVEWLSVFFIQVEEGLSNIITDLSLRAVTVVSNRATSLPRFFVKLVLAVISSFYISYDYENIRGFLVRQIPEQWREVLNGIKEFTFKKLLTYGKSYFMIMMITFAELAVGLMILRIESAVPIAFGIALFDIIPVLGTGGILIPWILIRFIQGDVALAVGLLVLYLLITFVRSIMEPKIVGSNIGIHPVLTLISIFIGASVFGFFGLIFAPVVVALMKYLKDEKIIQLYK